MNANASSFTYIVESIDMWHGTLGHVKFASIRKLKELRISNANKSHGTGE